MIVTQLCLNSVLAGAVVLLIAASFDLVYRTLRFLHFAHAIVFTAGAYCVLFFRSFCQLPLPSAVMCGVVGASLLGVAMELLVYRQLRRRKASPLVFLLASLGLYVVLQNCVSLSCGDGLRSIRTGPVEEGVTIFGARLTPVQIASIVISIIVTASVGMFLARSKVGLMIRATANDAHLAAVEGINTDKVAALIFVIGSACSGLAGILVALDIDMTPTMGMEPLMIALVVVIIGGRRGMLGIFLASLLVGFAQNLVAWGLGAQWQDAIVFFVLIVFLVLRPHGSWGRPQRLAAV